MNSEAVTALAPLVAETDELLIMLTNYPKARPGASRACGSSELPLLFSTGAVCFPHHTR